MFTNIINQYQNNTNFTHKIKTTEHDPFQCLPAFTTQTLLINYTLGNIFISRYFWVSSLDPDQFLFSTDLTYTIINSETSEILGQFYGFRNPDLIPFVDNLISAGAKFNIINNKFGGTATQLLRGKYKQLKSGKWRKKAA